MKTSTSLKCGFTLVEIMIVVAIIGLLAAVAIPNLIKARKTAQTTSCRGNLRTIEFEIQQWAIEELKNDDSEVSLEYLERYMKDGIPRCPSGGEYTLGTVEEKPTCNVKGHTIRPVPYIIKQDDTLESIAGKIPKDEIRKLNSEEEIDWDNLREGQSIMIPDDSAAAQRDSEESSGENVFSLSLLIIGGLILAIYWINFKKPKREINHFAYGSVDRSASSSTPLDSAS